MNSSIIQEIRNAFKITVATERIPNAIPVVEVGDKLVKNAIIKNLLKTDSASTTIYTTPTNQDFYLTGSSLSVNKNVTCDTDNVTITAVIGGAITTIMAYRGITLTAENNNIPLILPHSIKIDRGTNILCYVAVKTAGTLNVSATIHGFIDEYSNA